jgi:hypothetical protein
MKSKVAILRVTPETIFKDIDRLVELAGVEKALAPGKTTILKDNISWHFPFPAANTTPWQLEGTIQALARRGFTDQVCVQNKTVVTNAFKGEDLNHYVPIFKQYQVPVLYNFKDTDMKWIRYTPKARMRVLDQIFPEGIQIPLVDLLAIQKEIHSGLFAIMDGTTAGNGPGPRTMYPVVKNVMLASADQVAIDAVSAKMMGFDPMSLEYIRVAHEDGLGVGDPRDIEIVGDTDAAAENWHFHVGKNLVRVGGGDLIWFGPLKRFQKLFFHTPLVNGFILASDVYHDFYRWPLVDRRVFERWCETTEWGQMFLRYAHMGPQAQTLEAPAARTPTVPLSSRIH